MLLTLACSSPSKPPEIRRGIEVAPGPFDPCPTTASEVNVAPVYKNDASWYYETPNYIVQVCIPVPVAGVLLMYVKDKYRQYSLLSQAKPTQHGFACSGSNVSFEIFDISLRVRKGNRPVIVEPVTKAN